MQEADNWKGGLLDAGRCTVQQMLNLRQSLRIGVRCELRRVSECANLTASIGRLQLCPSKGGDRTKRVLLLQHVVSRQGHLGEFEGNCCELTKAPTAKRLVVESIVLLAPRRWRRRSVNDKLRARDGR